MSRVKGGAPYWGGSHLPCQALQSSEQPGPTPGSCALALTQLRSFPCRAARRRLRRNPSMRELPIPEIPIISVLQPGADALAAGAQLKHLMASAGSAPRDTLAS